MKVNTDGVLLGAIANHVNPLKVLDIGTGTGVIALMMAQRFPEALINTVEIDAQTAETAVRNFRNSRFEKRLQLHSGSFENYFEDNKEAKYNLIVSNPPFYINSLPSESSDKALAKHADKSFFNILIHLCSKHLHADGLLSLILPIDTAALVRTMAIENGLKQQRVIRIQSFAHSIPHREVLTFGFEDVVIKNDEIVIYEKPNEFTDQYRMLLRNFLTIF
jgi:tRNA1Val (adenine37-N6)-methyltransferase